MSNFSRFERTLSQLLSTSPGIKQIIKHIYIYFNYFIFRKNGKYRILEPSIHKIENNSILNPDEESFFGYYDKTPLSVDKVISYIPEISTVKKPDKKSALQIVAFSLNDSNRICIDKTQCYNWQQGARAQWLTNDLLIYNAYDEEYRTYCAKVYSFANNKIIRSYNKPVQGVYLDNYFLSINYRRLMALRPDYGYCNLPPLSLSELNNYLNDGLWRVEFTSGYSFLIHTLHSIISLQEKESFRDALHKINHVMISPDGSGCIFIHRYYIKSVRYDRLIYSNYKKMNVLADDGMVSHCCWFSNEIIFGYLRYKHKDGFYFINIKTGEVTECTTLNKLGNGDGHPSCYENFIVVDTYPDKGRMQKLLLYDVSHDKIYPLLEVFHGLKYKGETRCDLHPRFSSDGRFIFFDTVYTGKRTHCRIDVSHLTLSHN